MTSFDWVSDGTTHSSLRIVSLTINGSISAHSVPAHPIDTAFGSRNNFAMLNDTTLNILNAPSTKPFNVAEPNHTLLLGKDHDAYNDDDTSSEASGEIETPDSIKPGRLARRDSIVNPEDFMFDPRDTLRIDISVTMRRRAEQGYQFNVSVPS